MSLSSLSLSLSSLALSGVKAGQVSKYSLDKCSQKFQLLIFYPGDWLEESEDLLSQFSKAQNQLLQSECQVYGISSDSIQSHQQWMTSLSASPSFPLLSDLSGSIADKFGVPRCDEEAEDASTRCVVITDNEGVMLELVSSSLNNEQLVKYTLEKLEMLLEKRKRAVDREYREKMDRVELNLDMEIMLGSINTFTKGLVGHAARSRDSSMTRCRSTSRSLSRSRFLKPSYRSNCADPLAEAHYRRTVDKLVKGFF